jgi:hypothetical protein
MPHRFPKLTTHAHAADAAGNRDRSFPRLGFLERERMEVQRGLHRWLRLEPNHDRIGCRETNAWRND